MAVSRVVKTGHKRNSVKHASKILRDILFYVFLFNVIFIPNDTFNLKIISLGILLLLNIPTILSPKTGFERTIVFFGLFLTTFNILFSALHTKSLFSDFRLGYPGYILLLYPVVKRYRIKFYKVFILLLNLLSLFSVSMAILHFTRIVDMYDNPILLWYINSANALIGKGDNLPLHFMFFFKTSPLIFIGLVDALRRKRYFWTVITAAAILLSGTRANIIMLIAVLAIYLCFLHPRKRVRIFSIMIFAVALLVILIDGRVIDYFIDMFTRKGDSDAVRSGHLVGIFEAWRESPLKFFFGSGFSAEFYSYGIETMTASIELSYWNLLRQVGFFMFCLLMIMYLYPIIIMLKRKRNYALIFAYLIYLVIAYTNPFLYSSTGVTLLLFMYYMCSVKKSRMGVRKHERNNSCRRIRHKALPAY